MYLSGEASDNFSEYKMMPNDNQYLIPKPWLIKYNNFAYAEPGD
jgi:hypothetical protein